MKRAFLVLSIVISVLLSSCITGGNVFSAESGRSSLFNALSSSPSGHRTEERPIEEVLAAPEEEEPGAVSIPDTENEAAGLEEIPAPEPVPAEEEPLPEAVIEEAEEETAAPVPVAVEEVPAEEIPAPAEEPEPVPAEVVEMPEADEAEAEEVLAAPVKQAETEAPEVIVVEKENELMHYSVDGWMLRLMIVSIVAVILFTAATAIRSGAKKPFSRISSMLLAIAFTVLPWIASIAIAGNSYFWCVYLVLLLTYPIFRSENRRLSSR